jgi:hypothetical protein
MKETAVDYLFQKLWNTPKDKLTWYKILVDAKVIEKDEIINAYLDGYKSHPYLAEQYYKQNFIDK